MLECCSVWLIQPGLDGLGCPILEDINAEFHAGRISLVTGPTGAGKSSLLHILAGIMRPTQGQVLADGEPVSRWTSPHLDLWRRSVGIAFQNHHLLNDLTVLENVVLPMVPRCSTFGELRKLGMETLEVLGIDYLAGRSVTYLSWGERQRVVMARAIISRPEYLLADEPTAHQDDLGTKTIINCLEKAKLRGGVVIVATHDPRLRTGEFGDDRWRLESGRLIRQPHGANGITSCELTLEQPLPVRTNIQ